MMNYLIRFSILLFLLLPACPAGLPAQDIKPDQVTTADQPDETPDKPKKKKKDIDESFLLFEFDKLSVKFFVRA